MPKEIKIGCRNTDLQLFKIITVIQAYLLAKESHFEIEELRISEKYVYFINEQTTGLEGFIGREVGSGEVVFTIMDKSRIKWAELEGFTRKEAFEKIGVFIHAANMTSWLNWILGEDKYTLKGTYIKSVKED